MLFINFHKVAKVLLADGWQEVKLTADGKSTFDADDTDAHWFDATGNAQIYCPVTSILAVMVKEQAQAQPLYSGGQRVTASADAPFTTGKSDDAFLTTK